MYELKFTLDSEDGQVLSAYLRLREGKVHRTVELSEGDCYVDEDAQGRPLGVEMLNPATLLQAARRVTGKYHVKGIQGAVRRVQEQFAAH
jgi:uncharacterized protein YuzE